ncbi:MAG: DPP IV N-terminal domain-containing protein [Dehalococcoidia bacterium]|jgi:TolB protein
MINSKPVIIACLISLVALSSLFLVSCFRPAANYKPSGLPSLIAFASDRDVTPHIFTIKPDGSDVRATSNDNYTVDGLPAWSPDGKKIAFASDQSDDYEIWTMNEDGSGRQKVSNRYGWDGMPRWSPDGSKIAFVSEVHDKVGDTSYEIFVINADGSGMKQLTDSTTWGTVNNTSDETKILGWNSAPTWSPDSSKILFASNRDSSSISPILYIMNADGTDQKKFGLFFNVDGTGPNWSPVTNQIVFIRGSAAKGDIWVMDGSSPFPLLNAKKLTTNLDNNYGPVWSPDGKQIAYASDTYGKDNIFIMNADGTGVQRLTYSQSNNDRNPAWR